MKVRKIKDDSGWSLYSRTSNEFRANWKGGYDHFMLKKIYEQPSVIKTRIEEGYKWRNHSNVWCRG
jgi:glucosamine--fructose-6-phosphate aminotransferase (isomerizing)